MICILNRLDCMYYTLGKKSQPTPLQDYFESPLSTQLSQIFLGRCQASHASDTEIRNRQPVSVASRDQDSAAQETHTVGGPVCLSGGRPPPSSAWGPGGEDTSGGDLETPLALKAICRRDAQDRRAGGRAARRGGERGSARRGQGARPLLAGAARTAAWRPSSAAHSRGRPRRRLQPD